MKILVRTATAPNIEDATVLDELLATNGWQTLVTIARESSGRIKVFLCNCQLSKLLFSSPAAVGSCSKYTKRH